MYSTKEKDREIKVLSEVLGIPLVKITWWSNNENGRIWGLHLENGLTAMVTSAELLNQTKFQIKLIGVGLLPLDVRSVEWKETVVNRILQAAVPWTKTNL
jgi:hypothetical protein